MNWFLKIDSSPWLLSGAAKAIHAQMPLAHISSEFQAWGTPDLDRDARGGFAAGVQAQGSLRQRGERASPPPHGGHVSYQSLSHEGSRAPSGPSPEPAGVPHPGGSEPFWEPPGYSLLPCLPLLSPEEHAQAFLLLSPYPSTPSFCIVSFRPTWTVSFSPTCPCFEFLLLCPPPPLPAEELSSGLLLLQHGVPSPFLRPRDRGRGGDRSSALLREQCVGKTQLVSKVRTNAFQIIWDLLTCLLGALAPRCPEGLYLPLPRSL